MKLPVRRLHPDARLPTRGSEHAAGLDLRAAISVDLPKGCRVVVPTELSVEIPEGHVGLIWPRSGLAIKQGIDVLAGVIDADYRGEIGVVLINHGTEPVSIRGGDRIAQLLIQPVVMADPIELVALSETERGAGGFGSTGI
jgi:deoxyuridine 5'-triphosphate nucleotidohydrolase